MSDTNLDRIGDAIEVVTKLGANRPITWDTIGRKLKISKRNADLLIGEMVTRGILRPSDEGDYFVAILHAPSPASTQSGSANASIEYPNEDSSMKVSSASATVSKP